MQVCFLFPFQNKWEVMRGDFLAHLTTLFRVIKEIPYPFGAYLNHHLRYFLYARTFTKSWCSDGMFYDRCTNCKFINWYPDITI